MRSTMTTLNLIPIPELFVSAEAAEKLTVEGRKLPRWNLSPQQLCDLELLMNGGFFPLKGFMNQEDCSQVEREGHLTSGAHWPVTVKLVVDDEFAQRVEPGDDIGLWEGEDLLAIMSVTDHWRSGDEICLGGKVKGLKRPANAGETPNDIRKMICDQGWDEVTAVFGDVNAPDVAGPILRILPKMGQIADNSADITDDATLIARIKLSSHIEGPAGVQLQEIIARNYGATRVQD